MALTLELAGSFLGGAVTALGAVYYFGRRLVRRKLGGMIDLLGTPQKR